jgi:hypothetical protein
MSRSDVLHIPMCTVRRHPDGGFTPVLHASQVLPPLVPVTSISLPDPARAVQYARDHYGILPVVVADECRFRAASVPVSAPNTVPRVARVAASGGAR